jgi:DNA polymerase
VALDNLQRKPLEEFLAAHGAELPGNVREVLELRIEGARVSVKKLLSMLHVVCEDSRVRGVFLYWGARTGRWSGKLIQPHNYVRGTYKQALREWILHILGLDDAIEQLEMFFPRMLEALSNVMRGFIAAPGGRVLYVVDYANIESRIVVWLARQDDVVKLYRDKVDLYRWMGGHVYDKDPKDITSEERRCSKHIVLGCGFGMGPPKFVWTCKEVGGFDIELSFAEKCVKMYRTKMPKVKSLWYEMDEAAVECVRTGLPTVLKRGRIKFYREDTFLFMELPSGRRLSYPYPEVQPGRFGDEVTYMSEHPKTHQWVRESTYGGKLVENAVQAIARDIMVEGMIHAEKSGYEVDGTVHDEIITERDEGTGDLHEFEQLVCRIPKWADGCPIAAEAFTAKRWRKQ